MSGQRRAEGPGDRPEPFLLVATNEQAPDPPESLERSIESHGWKRWPANDSPGALRFWQGDVSRFLSLSSFPDNSLLHGDPRLDYGVSPQDLSRWQTRFRAIYILEFVHFYATKPLFD